MTTSKENKIKSTGFSIRKQINKTLEQFNLRGCGVFFVLFYFLVWVLFFFFSLFDTQNFSLHLVPGDKIPLHDKLEGTT